MDPHWAAIGQPWNGTPVRQQLQLPAQQGRYVADNPDGLEDHGNVHSAGLDGLEDQGYVHSAGLDGLGDQGNVHSVLSQRARSCAGRLDTGDMRAGS